MAMDYVDVDYLTEALSSIAIVQDMASRSEVPLHPSQCRFLASQLRLTRSSLEAKAPELQDVRSGGIRRTALRQLHFALKRAEKLLRHCCCEVEPSWLESAVTLAQVREDIVDVLLDICWWMSMVDIAITIERWGGSKELWHLKRAENDLEDLMRQLQSLDGDFNKAVAKDNEELLKRVRETQESHASEGDHEYLLATHVRTRLEKTDLIPSTADELNQHSDEKLIGSGSFGAVLKVEWLKRTCALKVLNCNWTKEVTTLSSFQHPHIVRFLRCWEVPLDALPGESPPVSSAMSNMPLANGDPCDTSSSEASLGKACILMEHLPTDLAKHLATTARKAASKQPVGSKWIFGARASISEATPMSQDVAIDVMLQVVKAMCYLNDNNVAHRDLKPSNVLLETVSAKEVPELAACGYVRVKLADFGLVNNTAMSTAMTTLSKNVGTTKYGAPEVFSKDSASPKEPKFPRLVDVWSFGIMFSEVLTGKPPFVLNEKYALAELQTKIRQGLRPELPATCPEYLKFCITQCWQLRPQDRPSFTDLRRLLRLAQARSLGIIHEDHDLFTFSLRGGVQKRLHELPLSAAITMDYLNEDYLNEALSSIAVVQGLASSSEVPLHPSQCRYLASELRVTQTSLEAKVPDLQGDRSGDVRRTALRQLHFALKRAESLLRRCCCEIEPSWLESAVTLAQIREDIVDILLDVCWWMSMVDIAITFKRWRVSQELELLMRAEKDLRDLTRQLQSHDSALDKAVAEDNEELLKRVRETQESHASKGDHDYLLAIHVRTRLEKTDLSPSANELSSYINGPLIGFGSYGAVQQVEWLKRKCALKMFNCNCTKEATTLSSFQHPHIVQFLRYWEAPFVDALPDESPSFNSEMSMSISNGDSTSRSSSEAGSSSEASLGKSCILMEYVPTDLAKYLATAARKAREGSRTLGAPASNSEAMPMSQDVAIDVMLQVAKAMCHLNESNVAHRDLRPSNVLVGPVRVEEVPELAACGYVRAKLADFGLANNAAMSTAIKTLSKNVGTRMYGAPEVFTGTKESASPKEPKFPRLTDVWSFGIMFSEVLTGRPPFVPNEIYAPAELHTKLRQGLRPELPATCPEYLKFCITQCLQLRPQDRPSFINLRRLLRFAQARSLGIIREDHDLFTFSLRGGGQKRLHGLPPDATVSKSLKSVFHFFGRFTQFFTKRRHPSRRSSSRADASLEPRQDQPLGYIVNRVWPMDASLKSSKVDVIFFEGNVGRRVFLSCKDTWVQRSKPDVWWPRDWLPKDFTDDLRVLLLEYSISDAGVKGVVDQLQQVLVFSKRWNRGHTWNRPIVLVGHSLGCVVIEQLVVALQQRASLNDDFEASRGAEAFLANLAGCFFYAPPFTGLEPDQSVLQDVFGGLTYKDDLFGDLSLISRAPQQLFQNFMVARRERVELMALVEGFYTLGNTVAPAAWMEEFKASGGIVKLLPDSNHSNTCKPTDKEHAAYLDLCKFIREIMERELM